MHMYYTVRNISNIASGSARCVRKTRELANTIAYVYLGAEILHP